MFADSQQWARTVHGVARLVYGDAGAFLPAIFGDDAAIAQHPVSLLPSLLNAAGEARIAREISMDDVSEAMRGRCLGAELSRANQQA